MENKKTKIMKLSTVIFVIIILALIGGIAYFVLQNNELRNKQVQSEEEMQALQSKTEQLEKTIEEIRNITSNTVIENTTTDDQTSTNNTRIKEIASSYISIINSIEKLKSNQYKYKLAYINEDDLPELIIDNPSYSTSIIMPNNNDLVIIKDENTNSENTIIKNSKIDSLDSLNLLGYGTSHRDGYQFVPRKNIIKCTIPDNDSEGNITSYTEIYSIIDNTLKMKANLEVKFTSNPSDNGKYYLNNKKISEEQYDDYFKELGDTESLEENTLDAKSIIKNLENMIK